VKLLFLLFVTAEVGDDTVVDVVVDVDRGNVVVAADVVDVNVDVNAGDVAVCTEAHDDTVLVATNNCKDFYLVHNFWYPLQILHDGCKSNIYVLLTLKSPIFYPLHTFNIELKDDHEP